MSVDNEQASSGDLSPLAQSTSLELELELELEDTGMHPSAPPSPESMNKMHLTNETTAEEVSIDEVAIVFSFLLPNDIMRARVCKTWSDAARKTLVPLCEFKVDSVRSYNAMRAMSSALPHLQQLSISNIHGRHKYSDGGDPDERRARYSASYATHDINIISNFRKLCSLEIRGAHLSGRYPVLFTFPLLTKLSIKKCIYLKFDLEMLVGIPLVKELQLIDNVHLTGNLVSLRVLKDTLEKLVIRDSRNIEGNFIDLADFPRLKELDLRFTYTRGDIRDIRHNDFPALEGLTLPETVRGGVCYKFQNISDVPSFMQAIHILSQRTPTLFKEEWLSYALFWSLGRSPNRYRWFEQHDWESETPKPPFELRFVQAGSRRGWSWCSYGPENCHSCEINWIDPEPGSESSDYAAYTEELQRIQRDVNVYRGYFVIPTEDEYLRLREEWP
eukprot:scaffold33624_cov191-Skeletonema_dohrnii-CCMP3373.AAC.3